MNSELPTEDAQLSYQGYEYVKKQETNTTHWICRHYRQIKWSSLLITSGSEIIKTPKDHICNFQPGATEAKQAKNKMKEKALTTANYVAIASTLQEIQNDVATQMNLPPQETIVKSLKIVKMVPATAFLPVEQVEDGFNLVMEEVGDILLRLKSDDEVSEKVEQFACYFQ